MPAVESIQLSRSRSHRATAGVLLSSPSSKSQQRGRQMTRVSAPTPGRIQRVSTLFVGLARGLTPPMKLWLALALFFSTGFINDDLLRQLNPRESCTLSSISVAAAAEGPTGHLTGAAAVVAAADAVDDGQKKPTLSDSDLVKAGGGHAAQFSGKDDDDDIPVVEGHGGTINIQVDSDVLVLTEDNFDVIVNSKPLILVNFFAPWCGHCQSLAPEYEQAATRLKGDADSSGSAAGGGRGGRIPLAKVDATVETALAARFGVVSYPTLLVFERGAHSEYTASLDADAIVEEMRRLADPERARSSPQPSVVGVLTSHNYSATLSRTPLALVEFYAPWCGHCRRLAPELERAARELISRSPPVAVFRVDATVETQLAGERAIAGYPTLYVVRRGVEFRYDGPRHGAAAIVNYMVEQSRPASEYVERQPQLRNLAKRVERTLVVGAFESLGSAFSRAFVEAANFERGNFTFVHTDRFDVAAAVLGLKALDTVALLQPEWLRSPFETVRLVFTNSRASSADLRHWMHSHCRPLVGHRTRDNLWKYASYPLVVVYYDVNFSHEYRAATQVTRKEVLAVARDYRDYHAEHELVFSISDEETFIDELKLLRLADSPSDVNVAFYAGPKERYAMTPTDDFDSDALRAFISDVLDGRLQPVRRSQLVPKRQSGAARIVVGATFEQEIVREPKDVFLLLYAPECVHCKNFMADFKKIANKYKGTNVKVAKMDAANNEFPDEFAITGYPTLFFVPAGEKKPLKFVGERNLQNVIDFIERHRSTPGGGGGGAADSKNRSDDLKDDEEPQNDAQAKDEL